MIRLRLLGPPALRRADGTAVRSVLTQPKRFALLAYLALAHPVRRDTLIGLLWPELDREHARMNLRQYLYRLRQSLGSGPLTGKGKELVGVDPSRFWCDVTAFDRALEENRPEQALALYCGPFLEGFHLSGAPGFERWQETERRGLHQRAVTAAGRLAERAEEDGERGAARRWAERALEMAPYDEVVLRRYLGLLDRQGDRATAVRAYEAYARRLAEDLELEPSDETLDLVRGIRSGKRPDRETKESPGHDGARTTGGSADTDRPEDAGSREAQRPESDGEEPPSPEQVSPASPDVDGGGPASRSGRARHRPRSRSSAGRQPARWRYAMLAALVLLAAWSVTAVLPDPGAPSATGGAVGGGPAEDVVVVFPFRVVGDDEEIGRGMVDLLTVKLAGTSQYRPVDAGTAVRAWRSSATGGSPGREDLLRAARALGAGKMVEGSVVRSGSRLVLTASVLDVDGGSSAEPLSIPGTPDELPALVDELAARLLAIETGEDERLASLTSPSLPAVRAWVRGRVAYRDARYRAAAAHFEEALRADSTFALAALDLLVVAEWRIGSQRYRRLGERLGWAGRARLTPTDRARLDVMLGPRYPAPSSTADELEADRRAVDLAPDSPEAWSHLADDLYHSGELLGVENALEQSADAFARALALDSTYAAPIGHLIEIRTLQGDTARVRALTRRYLSRHPDSELADFYRWRGAILLGDTAALTGLRSRWEAVPVQSLWRIVGYGRIDGRGLEDADTVAALLEARPGPPAERTITRTVLQGYYLDRGRPMRALAVQRKLAGLVPDGELPDPARSVREELVLGAIFWDGARDAAAAVVRELEESVPFAPSEGATGTEGTRELCLAAQWWAAQGERRSDVERAVRTLDGSRDPDDRAAVRARGRRCAALLRVMTAGDETREETLRRVNVLDSLSLTGPSAEFSMRANLASARALTAIGLEERALSIISRRYPLWHREYLAPQFRWRSRLAASLGEEEVATRAADVYRALRGAPPPRAPPLSADAAGGP